MPYKKYNLIEKSTDVTFDAAVLRTIGNACYEPIASTRLRSVREMKFGPEHIHHRFAVPGLVTLMEIHIMKMSGSNPLFKRAKRIVDVAEVQKALDLVAEDVRMNGPSDGKFGK